MARRIRDRSTIFHRAAVWWDREETQLFTIRLLAYGLFTASIVLSILTAWLGNPPMWVFTVYIAFVVQLTYLTFMYAIKRTGEEDVHRAIFGLRTSHVAGWRFEREMLAEFSRFAFCTANGIDPKPTTSPATTRTSLRTRRAPWPTTNVIEEICRCVRDDLTRITEASRGDAARETSVLTLDFIAYSSETFIELSRGICAEIQDLAEAGKISGPGFPARIAIRILVRETSEPVQWLVPLASDIESDRRYAAELRTRFDNVRRMLLAEFREELNNIVSARNVDFRVRCYRTEPLLKGVLVGKRRGLFGLYTVDELKQPSGHDYSGQAVTLCKCDTEGTFLEATAANFFRRGFDELWDNPQLTRAIDA